jgi:hypothetical protein
MKKKILFLVLFSTSISFFSQEKFLNNETDINKLSLDVVSLFEKNKVSESIDLMRPYWPLSENEIDILEKKTVRSLNIVQQRFGNAIGNVKIKTEKIKDIALRLTYLVRYDIYALRLKFTFYKNKNGWLITTFEWDDDYTEEFK